MYGGPADAILVLLVKPCCLSCHIACHLDALQWCHLPSIPPWCSSKTTGVLTTPSSMSYAPDSHAGQPSTSRGLGQHFTSFCGFCHWKWNAIPVTIPSWKPKPLHLLAKLNALLNQGKDQCNMLTEASTILNTHSQALLPCPDLLIEHDQPFKLNYNDPSYWSGTLPPLWCCYTLHQTVW